MNSLGILAQCWQPGGPTAKTLAHLAVSIGPVIRVGQTPVIAADQRCRGSGDALLCGAFFTLVARGRLGLQPLA